MWVLVPNALLGQGSGKLAHFERHEQALFS
jgi:hypothetical protein